MKRIGLVVSGGDAPGINAAIEAAVFTLAAHGAEAWGIRGGFVGLLAGDLIHLVADELLGSSTRGGALLSTSRDRVLAEPDARERLQQVWAETSLDGLIVLGGDGTIRRAASLLSAWGYPLMSIPCTIDNDVPQTERTLGFDSACNRALPMLDAIRDTATALAGRIFVVETLGGTTGHLAVAIAYAAQAHAVGVPEFPLNVQEMGQRLAAAVARHGFGICVVSEGIGDVPRFCADLAEAAGHRVRLTALGHAQRGGPPSYFDRWLGRTWGELAALELLAGRSGVRASWQAGQVSSVPAEAVSQAPAKEIDRLRYERINSQRQIYAAT